MEGTNHGNKSDPVPTQNEGNEQSGNNFGHASEAEQRPNRGLEDWEMVEKMSEPESGLGAWGLTVIGSFVLGFLVFVLLAYGVYYFLFHYGNLFFTSSGH